MRQPENSQALPANPAFTWTGRVEGKWIELHRQFGKLTEDDLAEASGDRTRLIGKLMARYQLTHEQAERRLFTWEQTMY